MASSIVLDVLSSLGAGKFKFLAQKVVADRVQRRLVEKNSADFFCGNPAPGQKLGSRKNGEKRTKWFLKYPGTQMTTLRCFAKFG